MNATYTAQQLDDAIKTVLAIAQLHDDAGEDATAAKLAVAAQVLIDQRAADEEESAE